MSKKPPHRGRRSVRSLLPLVLLAAGPAHAIETMRIAIAQARKQVELSARGLAMGPDEETAVLTPLGRARARVSIERGRLSVDGSAVDGSSVRFRALPSADGNDATLDAAALGPEPLRVGSTTVRGDVVVRLTGDTLQLLNVLPLEEYLVGVLGSEMPKSFPLEALKAQAVAARTYALHKKIQAFGEPAHLGAGVLSQVYRGLSEDDRRAREAVEATRGEVLTYNLTPIEAYFHASCGGRTEWGLDALGRSLPYLKSVDCPCGNQSTHEWTLRLTPAELKAWRVHDGTSTSIEVTSRTSTGRVRQLSIGNERVDAVTFRKRLGYSKLKSLAFEVSEAEDGAVLLKGQGHGHGAGLCQWGAKAYAERGWTYERILQHYYPRTELQALY